MHFIHTYLKVHMNSGIQANWGKANYKSDSESG